MEQLSVTMPDVIGAPVAFTTTGPVLVTMRGESDWAQCAVDLSGSVLWRHDVDGRASRLRAGDDGTAWFAHRSSDRQTLIGLTVDGSVAARVALEHEPHEHLGTFVVLRDGFCVAWLPARGHRVLSPDRVPRIARHGGDGSISWSTPIPFMELVLDDAPELAGKRTTLSMSSEHPLMVSGDRVAVTYQEFRIGIGMTSFLDTATGDLVAHTRVGPPGISAIVADGEFLVGEQGYGAFYTTRYDRSGTAVQRWASHAMLLVDRHGEIRGAEYENVTPSRSLFRGLASDGTLRDGPPLSAFYTSYPALDRDGTAVFWRDGQLRAVDADFQMRELSALPDNGGALDRVLLLDDGHVVFTMGSELLIFRDTGLGPLDDGVWPCGDGNLGGNPVAFED